MVDIQLFGRTVDSGLFFQILGVFLLIGSLIYTGYRDWRKKSHSVLTSDNSSTFQNCTFIINSINPDELDNKTVLKKINDCITKNIPEISGAVTKDATFELSDDKLKLLDAVSDKVGQYSKSTGKTVQDSDILRALGTEAYYLGQQDDALKYFSDALEIDEKQNNLEGKAIDLNNIGGVYQQWGKPVKALEYFQNALAMADELNYILVKAASLNNIGLVYNQWKNPEKALKYYEKSLIINETLKDVRGKAGNLNNIGMLYRDWGKPEKALEYFEKSLAINKELKDKINIENVKNNIKTLKLN